MSAEHQINIFKKLIRDRKSQRPQEDLLSSLYEENAIYWLLLKMCQVGRPELLSTVALQLGVDANALYNHISALHGAPDSRFPLSINRDRITRETKVYIEPDVVGLLRQAAFLVSPEHMPPPVLNWRVEEKELPTNTERFFHVFSHVAPPEASPSRAKTLSLLYDYPVEPILCLLSATEGLDDSQPILGEGENQLIRILTPNIQIILMPIICKLGTGYYADRLAVLDLRDAVQDYYSAAMPEGEFLPVMVSLGFTRQAASACLRSPKVLLMELWAFLRLIGAIQTSRRKNAAQHAVESLYHAFMKPGAGQFRPDGFANEAIATLAEV